MTVAKVLKKLIEDRGITYAYISKKTGVSVDAISKSLLGKRRLAADEMIAICKVTNIGLSDLLAAEAANSVSPVNQSVS